LINLEIELSLIAVALAWKMTMLRVVVVAMFLDKVSFVVVFIIITDNIYWNRSRN